ncbi:hypothetical protein FQN49_000307 [Arthroderma sp. PD_2]|nr:hypothetical protein FQN49_000307 [Arthroderma sp. PD_2]
MELIWSQFNFDDSGAELELAKAKLHRQCYWAQLGDYAGRDVDWMMDSTANKHDLPSTVSKLRDELAKEISTNREGWQLDFDMVQRAINAYAERNTAFHSQLRTVADDINRLAVRVEQDLDRLPSVLPNENCRHIDAWRKIIGFYPQSQELSFSEHIRGKLRVVPVENVSTACVDRST